MRNVGPERLQVLQSMCFSLSDTRETRVPYFSCAPYSRTFRLRFFKFAFVYPLANPSTSIIIARLVFQPVLASTIRLSSTANVSYRVPVFSRGGIYILLVVDLVFTIVAILRLSDNSLLVSVHQGDSDAIYSRIGMSSNARVSLNSR